jgi:peptidoglycan biosynthesis protein MviN/MurJ (putative lipid II flippase)
VLLIAVFFGLDKVVAPLRTVIIACAFAASALLDAFNTANNMPHLLFVPMFGGSLAMMCIPMLSEFFGWLGRDEGWLVVFLG